MSNENENLVKYCVHCGARITDDQTYCPECGKLVLKLKETDVKFRINDKTSYSQAPEKREIIRKCSGCGSMISSTVLEQCPICNTLLERIPEELKTSSQKSGFIFTDKKLEPEKKYELKPDSWNIKEGVNVFTNSLMVYITVQLLIIMMLWSQMGGDGTGTVEFNIQTILISQIPAIAFGLFPIWYIATNNHSFEKLGFTKDSSKIILALAIGLGGSLGLLAINFFASFINSNLAEMGLDLFDISDYISEENRIIGEADITWLMLLLILLCFASISAEIVFRGVLHNSLRKKFDDTNAGRLFTILSVALIYAGIYLIIYFPIGIVFFLLNFLVFTFLGLLYEINGNIYNTIIANIFYNILLIFLLL